MGGTAIALLQASVFLAFAPLAGIALSFHSLVLLIALCVIIGLGFTGLGFMVAWFMDTVAGYHAVMSVFFIPLWLLSGALFPVEGAAEWLGWVMRFNPVTYAMEVLRMAFYASPSELINNVQFLHAFAIAGGWSLLTMTLSVLIVRWRSDA